MGKFIYCLHSPVSRLARCSDALSDCGRRSERFVRPNGGSGSGDEEKINEWKDGTFTVFKRI